MYLATEPERQRRTLLHFVPQLPRRHKSCEPSSLRLAQTIPFRRGYEGVAFFHGTILVDEIKPRRRRARDDESRSNLTAEVKVDAKSSSRHSAGIVGSVQPWGTIARAPRLGPPRGLPPRFPGGPPAPTMELHSTPKCCSTLLLFERSVISAWGHLNPHEN